MPADSAPTWVDEEQAGPQVQSELRRLARRAARRPVLTLSATVLVAAGLCAWRARRAPSYTAHVVLRVTEGDLDIGTAPRPKGKLREYVLDAAFSGPRLEPLLRAHGLYPERLRRDPAAAVEAMRRDISVEVYRNDFLEERAPDDPARSARIAIEYQAREPQLALAVVRDLGQLLAEQEARTRLVQAEAAAREAALAVEQMRKDLLRKRQLVTSKQILLLRARPPQAAALRLEIKGLETDLAAEEDRLRKLDDQKSARALRVGLERADLGLRFELVDQGVEVPTGIFASRRLFLALVALLGFALGLPLVGMTVGAFDSRVYDLEDVRRLGLLPIGQVPRFAGCEVGSLRARQKAE